MTGNGCVVRVESSPALASADLLSALAGLGVHATIEGHGSRLGQVSLTIWETVPELPRRILAALDDVIARAGLPLISCRVGIDAYAVHPPAG